MAIDWDANVFGPVAAVFGETVHYRPASGLPFDIADAIFEEQYRRIELLDDNSAVTTEIPAMTVRLAEFLFGAVPVQNDEVTIDSRNATYVVKEVQLDNHGLAKLLLQLVGSTP